MPPKGPITPLEPTPGTTPAITAAPANDTPAGTTTVTPTPAANDTQPPVTTTTLGAGPTTVSTKGKGKATSMATRRGTLVKAPKSTGKVGPVTTNAEDVPDDVDDDDVDYQLYTDDTPMDYSEWNTEGICSELISEGYTVNQMLIDINGSTGFSEDKAALGTIHVMHHLQVTDGLNIPQDFELGMDPFTDDDTPVTSEEYQRRVVLFVWANWRALMDSNVGLSRENAVFLAILRLNVVLAGGVAQSLTARAVYVNEYDVSNATWEQVVLTDIAIGRPTNRYISEVWLQYVALLRHIFVTRGHHYKDEYLDLIDRTWKATTIEAPADVSEPSWMHILRTGLHCFGLRVLHLLTKFGMQQGLLASSFKTRYNAAPAGTAPVRTGWAAVENMKKAVWYPAFYIAYHTQIDRLELAAKVATRIGLRGHINAKLFNWGWTRIVVSDEPARALAPLILGFLDTLDRTESIKGQKTLDKRGDGGSAIRLAFQMVLSNSMRNARYMESVEAFFAETPATKAIPK